MTKERRPQFLGIGTQKCATRWLYEQLSLHPDIYLTPQKELHYFSHLIQMTSYTDRFSNPFWKRILSRFLSNPPNQHFFWWLNYMFGVHSKNWYSGLFPLDQDKKSGEITPRYSTLTMERICDVYDVNPEMRMIYLLRDPVSRAWSHFRMFVKKSKLDFDQMSEKEVFDFIGSDNCLAKGNYYECLLKWYKVFHKEQIFIGYLEQIKTNPVELIESILAHIGVEAKVLNNSVSANEPSHVGLKIPMESKYKEFLQDKYFQPNEDLFRLLGNPIIKNWNK